MSIQFTLVHGTSKACAQKIQSEGFLVSEMGFWGPAAYFYDRSENGIDLAKKWIDKKIKSEKIEAKEQSIILISDAKCHDVFYLDGTTERINNKIKAISKEVRKKIYEEMNLTGIKLTKREVDIQVNRERNAYIEDLEGILNVKFKIFRGLIKGVVCVAVRDVSCISKPPYEEVVYE